jgi:hypothetical protein
MNVELVLDIRGREVTLSAREVGSERWLAQTKWQDARDLADKFFSHTEALLRKLHLPLEKVADFRFNCDSPYFAPEVKGRPLQLEDFDSTGRCGFTAWQTGEILMQMLGFALKK